MNANTRKVLETVASGVWVNVTNLTNQCAFCWVAPHSEHADDCPVRLARQELDEHDLEQARLYPVLTRK